MDNTLSGPPPAHAILINTGQTAALTNVNMLRVNRSTPQNYLSHAKHR